MLEPQYFINGYLDETLSDSELGMLQNWLKAAPENADQFARHVLMHDRLRGLQQAMTVPALEGEPREHPISRLNSSSVQPPRGFFGQARKFSTTAMILIATIGAIAAGWKLIGESPVQAAVVEINRLVAANSQSMDRTFQITVEESLSPHHRNNRPPTPESKRPPKVPMNDAILHVRAGRQFVLIRKNAGGDTFLTGCNGKTSWAVRPDGPVRFSTDLTRFHRDVPGHEHDMPLFSIKEGLERLIDAYDIQLLPIEVADEPSSNIEASRLIVAVKKRGFRGPKRVEITYSLDSGQIQQMRFVEMPYGPDHLTLRMTLIDEGTFDADFFDHTAHHDSGRMVIEE